MRRLKLVVMGFGVMVVGLVGLTSSAYAQGGVSATQILSGLQADARNTRELAFYYSKGAKARVSDLRPLISGMQRFYKDKLGLDTKFSVVILSETDWQAKTKLLGVHVPYGLPFLNEQDIAFMPATEASVVMQGTMAAEKYALAATKARIERLGFKTYRAAAFRAVDVIGVHELGHSFARKSGIAVGNPFVDEFVADYFAYGYLHEKQDTLAQLFLAMYTDLYTDFFTVEKLKYQTLEDFAKNYASDVNTYSWYQGQFLKKADDIYSIEGTGFIAKLKSVFPSGAAIEMTKAVTAFEKIAPGSKQWIKATFGDSY